jgi:DNA-binding IclR family transcriptional regulator
MTPGVDRRRAPEYVIGSVDRALRVLLMLRGQRALTLTAVSRALGVAPSTAHRLLTTLMHHDFVRQDAASRAYLAGTALLEIGLAAASSPRVPVRVTDRTGATMPAHCTAGGKVLLAQLTSEALGTIVGPGPLAKMTPRTRTGVAQLQRELREIQRTGYATNFGESEPGLSAVAAAIPDPRGISTVSVSVSVPSEYVDNARVRQIAAAVIAAAQRIGALAAGDGGAPPH